MKSIFRLLAASAILLFALGACDEESEKILEDITSITLTDVNLIDGLNLTLEKPSVMLTSSTKADPDLVLLASSGQQSIRNLAEKHSATLDRLSKVDLKKVVIEAVNQNIRFSDYFTYLEVQIKGSGVSQPRTVAQLASVPSSSIFTMSLVEVSESDLLKLFSGNFEVMIYGKLKSGVTSVSIPIELDAAGDLKFRLIQLQ